MNGRQYRNHILSALAKADLAGIAGQLEKVPMAAGQVLEQPNAPISHVYFPESGIASVVAVNAAGRQVETGPFGWDGMSGLAVVNQAERSPSKTLVQMDGVAFRLPVAAFQDVMDRSTDARRLFLRYAYAFSLQTAHTVLAASIALVEQRLARWLLMLHDRVDGDELALTHDFMAFMLAVRRPGVTVALHELEGKALIRSHRGRVIIRSRDGLIELCGGIYGIPEAEYRRLIPQPGIAEAA